MYRRGGQTDMPLWIHIASYSLIRKFHHSNTPQTNTRNIARLCTLEYPLWAIVRSKKYKLFNPYRGKKGERPAGWRHCVVLLTWSPYMLYVIHFGLNFKDTVPLGWIHFHQCIRRGRHKVVREGDGLSKLSQYKAVSDRSRAHKLRAHRAFSIVPPVFGAEHRWHGFGCPWSASCQGLTGSPARSLNLKGSPKGSPKSLGRKRCVSSTTSLFSLREGNPVLGHPGTIWLGVLGGKSCSNKSQIIPGLRALLYEFYESSRHRIYQIPNVLGFPHISHPGPVATVANSTGHGRPWHRCPLSHGLLHTVTIVIYSSYALCTFAIIPKKVNSVNFLGILWTRGSLTILTAAQFLIVSVPMQVCEL